MPTIRTLLAGLLLLAAFAVSAAPAAAQSPTALPPGITIPKITALRLVRATYEVRYDWRVIPRSVDGCAAYVKGDGTQLMKVELKKPTDYALVEIGKTLQLSPSNRAPRFTSAVSRLFDWDRRWDECACGPNSEYGECEPQQQPTFNCTPRIDPGSPPKIDIYNGPARRTGDELYDDLLWSPDPDTTLNVLATPGKRFEDCPPSGDSAGNTLDLPMIDATSWRGGGWARQLAALKPGQRATLTNRTLKGISEPSDGRRASGSFRRCPAKPRAGNWRCERGAVRLTFERR